MGTRASRSLPSFWHAVKGFLLAQIDKRRNLRDDKQPWSTFAKRDALTTLLLPLLTKTRTGSTLTNERNREGGFIHETFKFSKTGRGATAKWLTALTTANRKKNTSTFDFRSKGMHTLEVITPTLRATPLYLGQKVEVDGVAHLLATTSPYVVGEPKLRLVDLDALTRVVLVILQAEGVEDSGLLAGETFTKAKAVADFGDVAKHLPGGATAADDDEYIVVQVPVAILLGGQNMSPHGRSVDEVRPMFADFGDDAVAWHDAIRTHTSAAGDALIAAAADMGACLPALKASQTAADTALVTVTPPDDDQLEAVGPAVARLVTVLAELAEANRALADTDDDASRDGAGGVPKEIRAKLPRPGRHGREGAQVDGTASTGVTTSAGALTSQELRMTRMLLYLAGVQRADNDGAPLDEAHAPLLTDDALQVQESSEKKLRISLTADLIDDAQEAVCETTNAFRAFVDLQKIPRLAIAQFLEGEWGREPIKNLRDLGSLFTLLYFLPHSQERRQDDKKRKAQELLGEDSRRMAELATTFSCARRIDGLAGLLTYVANARTFLAAHAICDPSALEDLGEGRNKPLLVEMLDEVFETCSALKFRRRWDETKAESPWVIYTIAHFVDTLASMMAKGARTSRIARKVAGGEWEAALPHLLAARAYMERRLADLREYADGGDVPKSCGLYESSDERRDGQAAAAALQREQVRTMAADLARRARPARDDARERAQPQERRPPRVGRDEGDMDGDVYCTLPKEDRMPLPTINNKKEWPCAPYYRVGLRCKHGAECRRAHIPIDDLSPESQKIWMDHVQATSTIHFNPKRVKIMATELVKPAAATKPAGRDTGAQGAAAGKGTDK